MESVSLHNLSGRGLDSAPLPYLDVLVPGADSSEQILDLLLMLLGLMGTVSQHFLEKAVF